MPRHIEFSCIFRQGSRVGRAYHPHNEGCFEAAGVRDTFISVEWHSRVNTAGQSRAGRPRQHKAVMAQGRAHRAAAALRRSPGAERGRSPWRRLRAVCPSAGGGARRSTAGARAVRRPRPGSAMPAPTAHLHLCSTNCSTRSAHAPPPAGAPG